MFRIYIFLFATFALAHGSFNGTISEERIIGGENGDILQFPYQLALIFKGNEHCGASILSEKWALTAAHCVLRIDVYHFRLRAGSNWWNRGGSLHTVEMSIWHPLYQKYRFADYDFAVLKVYSSFPLGEPGISPISLSTQDPQDGQMAIVSGWGVTQRSMHLNKVYMPVVGRNRCNNLYGDNLITNRMVCAGWLSGGKSTCFGDSGGPLVLNGKQIGIVSWQKGCALKGYPAVFANVANQRAWIRQTTGV